MFCFIYLFIQNIVLYAYFAPYLSYKALFLSETKKNSRLQWSKNKISISCGVNAQEYSLIFLKNCR